MKILLTTFVITIPIWFSSKNVFADEIKNDYQRIYSGGIDAGIIADTTGLLGFNGAVSINNPIINHLGVSYGFEPLPYGTPSIQEFSLFVGHEFRPRWHFIYLPVNVGLSGNIGIDRGRYLYTDSCFWCEDHYAENKFAAVGVYFDFSPCMIFDVWNITGNGKKQSIYFGPRIFFNQSTEFFKEEAGFVVGVIL